MSLNPDYAGQLTVLAPIATGFAGFAGVIGAFSEFRMHAEATAFRVRAMVTLALMEVIFSLLPWLIANFGLGEATTWRIAGGFLATAAAVAVVIMSRQASILYRTGRLMRMAAYILSTAAVAVIAPLYATVFGLGAQYLTACYFATMFFGIVVCAYHFMMLMIAVRLDKSE